MNNIINQYKNQYYKFYNIAKFSKNQYEIN